jgi:CRP-like cAMP-binding protein
MGHILLLGPPEANLGLAAVLHPDHVLTLVASPARLAAAEPDFDLIVAAVVQADDLAAIDELARRLAVPWVLQNAADSPTVTAAYRAGALAALSRDAPPDVAVQTLARLLSMLGAAAGAGRMQPGRRFLRHHRAGERIPLDPESTLDVEEGVVGLTVLYGDGEEVLLGLYGPGSILPGHPDDACCLELYAHTAVRVDIRPWLESRCRLGFAEQMRARLWQMEAWAAMQARPQLEQRLLGLLTLLSEQFGRPTTQGTEVDLRITHAQLASAVGATRATVTRRLGAMRRQGLLSTIGSGPGERFRVREGEGRHHSPVAG